MSAVPYWVAVKQQSFWSFTIFLFTHSYSTGLGKEFFKQNVHNSNVMTYKWPSLLNKSIVIQNKQTKKDEPDLNCHISKSLKHTTLPQALFSSQHPAGLTDAPMTDVNILAMSAPLINTVQRELISQSLIERFTFFISLLFGVSVQGWMTLYCCRRGLLMSICSKTLILFGASLFSYCLNIFIIKKTFIWNAPVHLL